MQAQTTDEILREFGRAYVWMLPGILLSFVLDGLHNGGLSLGAVLTFAGAAKGLGLHPERSLLRLMLHRAFDFIGKVVFYGIGVVAVAAGLALVVDAAVESDAIGAPFWIGGLVALTAWPLYRGWPILALPFVTPDFFGGEARFKRLWVSPGLLYAWGMTKKRIGGALGVPVMIAVYGVFLVYFLASPSSDGAALPASAGSVLLFVLVPVMIFVVVRQGHVAFQKSNDFARAFDRWDGKVDDVPPAELLRLAIGFDNVLWMEDASTRGARLLPQHVIHAAAAGSLNVLRHLPDRAIGDDIVGDGGETILHAAAREGHDAVLAWALSKGLNVDAGDREGRTPLHYASRNGKLDASRSLLDAGADVHRESIHGRTALSEAIASARREIVQLLLDYGADPTSRREDEASKRESPMYAAVYARRAEIFSDLLKRKNVLDPESGEAADLLCRAAADGNEEIVRILLDHGVDPFAESEGLSAIDAAEWMNVERPSEGRRRVIQEIECARKASGPIETCRRYYRAVAKARRLGDLNEFWTQARIEETEKNFGLLKNEGGDVLREQDVMLGRLKSLASIAHNNEPDDRTKGEKSLVAWRSGERILARTVLYREADRWKIHEEHRNDRERTT